MNHCAHIFVGREFSTLVPTVSKQILRTGGEFVSCANIFVMDGNNIVGYQSKAESEVEIAKGNIITETISVGEIPLSHTEDAAQFFKEKIFDKIIYTGNGDSLIIEIHLPLYKSCAVETALSLFKAISLLKLPKKIDLVCYADDLAGLIESNYKITSASKKQVDALRKFKEQMHQQGILPHIILFQNSDQSGLSLNLDTNALAEIITTYAILCIDQYETLFPNTKEYKDVIGLGFMRLSLNKYQFVEYLLHKALLGSMNHAEISQDNIDINLAWETANRVIGDKTKLLSSLFKTIDEKVGKDDEILKYQKELETNVEEILDRIKKEFEYNNGITMKAAILAALLNKTDCELFSNIIFNNELTNINDLYDESISYFVNNNTDDFYQIDDEPIVNPIAELKDITSKLINAQTQVKFLQSQLNDLEKNIELANKVEDCYVEDGKFVFHGQHFRLLPQVEQEPLAETYEAHDNLPDSVDLKKYFNNIKNQGDQGSCLAHAVTSIFEYAMKRNAQKEVDLSEAFLYYNARSMDKKDDVSTQEDSGSRYKPAMDSLAKYGIALERYCPYNDHVYTQKPSDEAYADAATRKLLVAKNVKLNIIDIKSALADGYPVAGNFGLMSSFFNVTDGYIPMPSEEEIAEDKGTKKHSHHAMVIVGYSDALRMFVVRNSWGQEWGEKGYCYLPYEYVENETLCSFCCIITEIEQLELPKLEVVPALKVDDGDLKIRSLMASAALKKEQLDVAQYQKQRESLLLYLEHEKKLLSAPNLKNDFIAKTEEKIQGEIEELTTNKKAKEIALDDLEESFRKEKIKIWVAFAGVVLGCILIFLGINYLLNDLKSLFDASGSWRLPLWILLGALGVTCGFFGIKAHKAYSRWKEQRDDINREIERLTTTLKEKKLHTEKLAIRTNSAWALIRALESNEGQIFNMYTNIISLINNLRVWYDESIKIIERNRLIEENRIPILPVFDYKIWNEFYETQMKNGSEFCIDFIENIEKHTIDPIYLKEYKDALLSKLIDKVLLLPSLRDYNMTEMVANPDSQTLSAPISKELLEKLDKMSNVFLQVNSKEQGVITPSCNVFAPSVNGYHNQLSLKFEPYDAILSESSLKYDIVMVKSVSVKFSECVILS